MRNKVSLNGLWNFAFTGEEKPDPAWVPAGVMSVPGCFDLMEPDCGKRGFALCTRTVFAGGKNLLEIDGAGVSGEVYFDGKLAGKLPYAYLPEKFLLDAGEFGEHRLTLILDNRHNLHFQPTFDFFAYGGVYGDIDITPVPEKMLSNVRISTVDYASGRIRIQAEYSDPDAASVHLAFDTGYQTDVPLKNGVLDVALDLPGFKLWSVDSPALHRVMLSAGEDEVAETFGIREFKTEGRKFVLNGKPIKILGVNRHESTPVTGAAVSPQMTGYDLKLIKNAGFNFIRGCHYPQRKHTLELCDRLGLLMWEETLSWGVKKDQFTLPEYRHGQLEQAAKMTMAGINHPCVVMRGFLNEFESDCEEARPVVKELYDTIRALDPKTIITFASCMKTRDVCLDLVDAVCMNIYPGWYDSRFDSISTIDRIVPKIRELSGTFPKDKPYLLTEIGAGAPYGFRDPLKTYWSEEYQRDLVRTVLEHVVEDENCSGVVLWQFADCRTYVAGPNIYHRGRGFNDKGLIDEYRRPKLAWHCALDFLKSYHQRKEGKK